MTEMVPVISSNIESIGYDHEKEELHIKFKGGKTYMYKKVPISLYEELISAASIGKFFAANIRDHFNWEILL